MFKKDSLQTLDVCMSRSTDSVYSCMHNDEPRSDSMANAVHAAFTVVASAIGHASVVVRTDESQTFLANVQPKT